LSSGQTTLGCTNILLMIIWYIQIGNSTGCHTCASRLCRHSTIISQKVEMLSVIKVEMLSVIKVGTVVSH